MSEIKILSLNVQEMGLLPKRTDMLHYLKEKNYQIYCLQDTHFSPGLEKFVQTRWNGDCYFSSYKSNARGIAILFNKDFIKLYDGPDIKLFILVGWGRSFLSVAWPTGVQLVFFFCSGVSRLFGAQGSPSSGSLLSL